MKTTIISFSFRQGGAAIAARKFALIARKFSELECYSADNKTSHEIKIKSPNQAQYIIHFIARIIEQIILKTMNDNNPVKHSLNLFSSKNVLKGIEKTKKQKRILNIHWINNDTLSLWQLRKLPIKTIITLHDEWLYCGTEHYSKEKNEFEKGYTYKDTDTNGVNLNYIAWKIKLNQLKTRDDLIFTVPSEWMLKRAKSSKILKNKDIRLLPNPIDTEIFKIQEKIKRTKTRQLWEIKNNDIFICFGAIDGNKNHLKGGEKLLQALSILEEILSPEAKQKIIIGLFGGEKEQKNHIRFFKTINIGRIENEIDMVNMYNAADILIVPSLVESFGQVAAESLACGTPVAAFSYSGILDIIKYEGNFALAKPFDEYELATIIKKLILMPSQKRKELGLAGRNHILNNFSIPAIEKIYKEILNSTLRHDSKSA